MTKDQFKQHWLAMYRVGNRADHESHEDWTRPPMAGKACCSLLDRMATEMMACGVLTREEHQDLYNCL